MLKLGLLLVCVSPGTVWPPAPASPLVKDVRISPRGSVLQFLHAAPDGHFNDFQAGPVDLLDEAEDGRQHVGVPVLRSDGVGPLRRVGTTL